MADEMGLSPDIVETSAFPAGSGLLNAVVSHILRHII